GRIFARSGGKRPPLLPLHGYPQTNVMWHRGAPALAAHFSLIIPDFPRYGWARPPPPPAAPPPPPQPAPAPPPAHAGGGARSRALSPRRARSRRPRRLSARARPSRAARTARRARHRADLGHVAPHGRSPRHARLALDVPRAASAVPGDDDRQGGALLLRYARRGRNQEQESLGLRSARACALPRLLQRSGAHPRDLRGLSRWPHHRSRPRRGNPCVG